MTSASASNKVFLISSNSGGDGQRGIERNGIRQVLWEPALGFLHELANFGGSLQRVGAGREVDTQQGRRLAVEAAFQVVVLRSQFHPRHVLQAQHAALRCGTNNDLAELFRRGQAARCAHVIGERLSWRDWGATDLAGRVYRVLRLNGADDFRNGNAEIGQRVRIHPDAHGVLAGAEDRYRSDARQARQRIVQIDVGVIGQKDIVVGPVGRRQREQHQRR